MKNVLYIIRGMPGSGKTTLAKLLPWASHYEADMFFETKDGYKFDPSKLGEAHRLCRDMTSRAMAIGEPLVIVSNTFTKFSEAKDYIEFAAEFDYEVKVHTCNSDFGSIHAVPEKTLQKMRDRFMEHDEFDLLAQSSLESFKILIDSGYRERFAD